MAIEAPERTHIAGPSRHGEGITLICPGCGAEVKVRRLDEGARKHVRQVECPFCGTPLEPAPAPEPEERSAGARLPWLADRRSWQRLA